MLVPLLAQEIINTGAKYVNPLNLCYEESNNKGTCITELKCYYDGKVDDCNSSRIGNEAYCALGAWAIVDQAVARLGGKNILPKTKGAAAMLSQSKKVKGLRVDKIPFPGAVFYRKSTAAGASGHIGIVSKIEPAKQIFHTIEANMEFTYEGKKYEGVWGRYYSFDDISKRGFQFIHTEEMMGLNNMVEVQYLDTSKNLPVVHRYNLLLSDPKIIIPVIIAGLSVGYWYLTKKR